MIPRQAQRKTTHIIYGRTKPSEHIIYEFCVNGPFRKSTSLIFLAVDSVHFMVFFSVFSFLNPFFVVPFTYFVYAFICALYALCLSSRVFYILSFRMQRLNHLCIIISEWVLSGILNLAGLRHFLAAEKYLWIWNFILLSPYCLFHMAHTHTHHYRNRATNSRHIISSYQTFMKLSEIKYWNEICVSHSFL